MKYTLQFLFAFLFCLSAAAQITPPYLTGFDTPAEKAGWHEIRIGSTEYYGWTYANAQAATPPTCLHHDYPVGNVDADTVEDWFVSPQIAFYGGNTLSFRYYVYSITGGTFPVDYFGVWYSPDSDDPAGGDYIELANLTNKASTAFEWKDTSNIAIPATSDSGYIAFRYRATNNWFIPNVNSVYIDGFNLSQTQPRPIDVKVFPTITENSIAVQTNGSTEYIALVDALGRVQKQIDNPSASQQIDMADFTPGVYQIIVREINGSRHAVRVVKQ